MCPACDQPQNPIPRKLTAINTSCIHVNSITRAHYAISVCYICCLQAIESLCNLVAGALCDDDSKGYVISVIEELFVVLETHKEPVRRQLASMAKQLGTFFAGLWQQHPENSPLHTSILQVTAQH
jgi:hypothetical protein